MSSRPTKASASHASPWEQALTTADILGAVADDGEQGCALRRALRGAVTVARATPNADHGAPWPHPVQTSICNHDLPRDFEATALLPEAGGSLTIGGDNVSELWNFGDDGALRFRAPLGLSRKFSCYYILDSHRRGCRTVLARFSDRILSIDDSGALVADEAAPMRFCTSGYYDADSQRYHLVSPIAGVVSAYDPHWKHAFTYQLPPPARRWCVPTRLAFDPSANTVAVAYTISNAVDPTVLVHFDLRGRCTNRSVHLPLGDALSALAIDARGNVHAAGKSGPLRSVDCQGRPLASLAIANACFVAARDHTLWWIDRATRQVGVAHM